MEKRVTEIPNSETQPPPPPNHQMDADDDDENVKQLKECSSLYLSLQDCLVDSNRDWKSCQKQENSNGVVVQTSDSLSMKPSDGTKLYESTGD